MVLSLSIEEDKDVSVPSLHPNKLNNNEININAFLFIKSILSFRLRLFYFTIEKLSPTKKVHKKSKKLHKFETICYKDKNTKFLYLIL